MRLTLPTIYFTLLGAAWLTLPLRADNYLENTDFKNGIQGWHGDGTVAFLKADGTEGAEGDADVTPVIRIPLSKSQVHSIYEDYATRDNPKTQHIKVEVFASSDFKRSTFPSDYSGVNWKAGSIWYWSDFAVPDVDFWIRGAPGYIYKLANLKPGQWVTVDGKWDSPPMAQDRTVNFVVPPGTGIIYIKNPFASP